MSFLHEAVTYARAELQWAAPEGLWARHAGMAAWLDEPVSTAFASWVLDPIFARAGAFMRRCWGDALPEPRYVLVHGWCYQSVGRALDMRDAMRLFAALPRSRAAVQRATGLVPALSHLGSDWWRDESSRRIEPALAAIVARAHERRIDAELDDLVALLDDAIAATSDLWLAMLASAGHGARVDHALAELWSAHVLPRIGVPLGEVLPGDPVRRALPAGTGLDWIGEAWASSVPLPTPSSCADVVARASAALADDPRRARELARRWTAVEAMLRLRERQAHALVSAWPTLRDVLVQIGALAHRRGWLDDPAEILFVRRGEVIDARDRGEASEWRERIAERRGTWTIRRSFAPPWAIDS